MDPETNAARARHDIGNALAIARASVEAMIDGVVPPTEERLKRIREILIAVAEALDQL